MVWFQSSDLSAQYRWSDCIKVTRLGSPGDSVLVISVEDSCRHRVDTIYVNDGKLTNGGLVLKAPSDSTITFRYAKGRIMWVMTIDTTDADTTRFLWQTFITPARYDTNYVRVAAPDTIAFLTNITPGAGGGDSTFLQLRDTPSSYTGHAGKVVKVNPTADALVFADDNVGGGTDGGMTYDTTNVFVHDSAYIFEGRWMKPRLIGEQPPTGTYISSTDSLLVKTAIGWKEFEVHFIRPQGITTQIEFEAFADSANGRFLLCAIGLTMDALELGGLSIIGNLEYNITGIVFAASSATWYQNVTSGVLRSGATASRPSITSFVYPGADSKADGHRSVYYNRVQLYTTRSTPALWSMVIRVYYGRRLDSPESASDWDVTLKF